MMIPERDELADKQWQCTEPTSIALKNNCVILRLLATGTHREVLGIE